MSSSERLRLQVSPWLALLLGAFVLLSSPALLAALLTAALVHELAHWAVLRRLGGEVRSLNDCPTAVKCWSRRRGRS